MHPANFFSAPHTVYLKHHMQNSILFVDEKLILSNGTLFAGDNYFYFCL